MRIEDFKLFLMVDDSDDELFLTKAIFQHAFPGVQFRCEKDPAQAMAQLGRAAATGINPAQMCVLLDIRMPRTNGFELIYKLRNDINTYACCIVMLSASRGLDDRDNAAALGAEGYLSKPFTVAKLQDVLASHTPTEQAA
jgi:two-component system, response regulator